MRLVADKLSQDLVNYVDNIHEYDLGDHIEEVVFVLLDALNVELTVRLYGSLSEYTKDDE